MTRESYLFRCDCPGERRAPDIRASALEQLFLESIEGLTCRACGARVRRESARRAHLTLVSQEAVAHGA